MKHLLLMAAIAFFAVAAYHLNRIRHTQTAPTRSPLPETGIAAPFSDKGASPETLRSTAYLERYITHIIIHGSQQRLGFKYGDMPAGMADTDAAPKIAAYVATLSGRKPSHPEWAREGRLFYISNCGGCHGEDGKGIRGTFPDLTRDPLLGIARRTEQATRNSR